MKMHKFEKERFENDLFSVSTQKRRRLKTLHIPLLIVFITMAFKSRLAPIWQQLTKGFVLKRRLTIPFCWSNVDANRYHRVFI